MFNNSRRQFIPAVSLAEIITNADEVCHKIFQYYSLSQNISILQTVVLQISFKNILTKSSIASSDVGLHLYLIFECPTYHSLTTYVHESLIMHHP